MLYQGCQGKAEDPSWRNSDWCCGEKEANWSWREGSGQKRQRISCYSETTRWSWELQSGNNCTRKKVLTLFIQMYSVLFSDIFMVWIYWNFWVTGLITSASDNLIVFVILEENPLKGYTGFSKWFQVLMLSTNQFCCRTQTVFSAQADAERIKVTKLLLC